MRKFIYCICVCGLPLGGFAQALKVGRLRCEYRDNPLGMDVLQPRLSWTYNCDSANRYQSAYRILLASSEELLDGGRGDWWDSGKVGDSENINIVPAGKPLKPFTRYYWKVMAWDQNGVSTAWSPIAWFETGMLDSVNWRGKWIGDGRNEAGAGKTRSNESRDERDFYKDDPAPVLRREFTIGKKVLSARLYIAGLGYNEDFINGRKVGDALLDPAWTDYGRRIYYSVYDVTASLHTGRNRIEVLLGNGWYNPLPLRFWGRINFREALTIGRPKALANLRIVYTDGSTEVLATDEHWLAGKSGILRNNVFLGEKIDGRVITGDWAPAVATEAPGGRMEAAMMPSIGVRDIYPTRKISEPAPHIYVADMGQNFAGSIQMRLRGRAGQEVHFRYGEILQPDGRVNGLTTVAGQIKEVYHINGGPGAPPTAYQEDEYICRGGDPEIFQPRFSFHGFRYVEIIGLDSQPAAGDLFGVGLSTRLAEPGSFECSDTLLNAIQQIVKNTFSSNLFSVQSDCPGREKQGYGGDIVATADAFMWNFDMSCFYAKTLDDFADAVRPNGGMPECAPYNGIADEGFGEGSGPIGWQLAFPYLQREMWRFYGNRRVMEEQYGRTVRLVEFLHSQAGSGLIDHGIGDHEAVNPKHVPLTSAAFYYGHVRLLGELAGLLGKGQDQRRWTALADTIRTKFNRQYLQGDGARYDTAANQTTQAFPLWWGLTKDSASSFGELVRLIEGPAKGHLSTGIFGTKMLFDVLDRYDRNDLAFRIASQRSFPGYGYMRDHGATTLIESWALTDQNSWNHPMFGSVSEWFYRGLAGIHPADDAYGMDKILFRVRPVGGLTHVNALYWSIRGWIVSEWTDQNGVFTWIVGIPPNTRGIVDIPANVGQRVMMNGREIAGGHWKDGYFRVPIASGRYEFRVERKE